MVGRFLVFHVRDDVSCEGAPPFITGEQKSPTNQEWV